MVEEKSWGKKMFASPAGNRTRVFRVTGGDTYHYTTEDDLANPTIKVNYIMNVIMNSHTVHTI